MNIINAQGRTIHCLNIIVMCAYAMYTLCAIFSLFLFRTCQLFFCFIKASEVVSTLSLWAVRSHAAPVTHASQYANALSRTHTSTCHMSTRRWTKHPHYVNISDFEKMCWQCLNVVVIPRGNETNLITWVTITEQYGAKLQNVEAVYEHSLNYSKWCLLSTL